MCLCLCLGLIWEPRADMRLGVAPPSIGWTGRRPLVPHKVALFSLIIMRLVEIGSRRGEELGCPLGGISLGWWCESCLLEQDKTIPRRRNLPTRRTHARRARDTRMRADVDAKWGVGVTGWLAREACRLAGKWGRHGRSPLHARPLLLLLTGSTQPKDSTFSLEECRRHLRGVTRLQCLQSLAYHGLPLSSYSDAYAIPVLATPTGGGSSTSLSACTRYTANLAGFSLKFYWQSPPLPPTFLTPTN